MNAPSDPDQEPIPCGAFDLDALIGQGGMGQIWRGRHRASGAEVAVKVLRGAGLRARLFRREAQSVAGLGHHPHIITVFDYGDVSAEPPEVASRLGGDLWLAMEYLERGSLADARPIADWAGLRAALMQILDALAHAHARGVIHRDLKPGNVLLAERGEALHVKLSDFGLAHTLSAAPEERRPEILSPMAGTPAYMAPEQFQGQWRDYGPWTDLYALGCMAWELCVGRLPFEAVALSELSYKHLHDPLPPLEPRFEVPVGLEGWLQRLTAKTPEFRYRRAADARHALTALEPGARLPARPSPAGSASAVTVAPTPIRSDPEREAETLLPSERGVGGVAPTLVTWNEHVPLPPLPALPDDESPPMAHLSGVGLGLYGLREIPLVGREAERQRLWEALRDVQRAGRARAVVLEGPSGVGKSVLARWAALTAHARGGVHLLRATHSPIQAFSQGLPRMMGGWAGVLGLDRGATYRRLSARLGDAQLAAALTEVIRPGGTTVNDGVPLVRFSSQGERLGVIGRFIQALAQTGRPVVLWLEDAQWQPDALQLARWLLTHEAPATPILLLLTLRRGALEPTSERLLAALLDEEGADAVALEPFGADAHGLFLDALLALAPELRARVVERTLGDPVFAVHLLEDWVQEGALLPSEAGWRLKEGAALPATREALWSRRLDHLAARFRAPGDVIQALEIASILGEPVEDAEWTRLCAEAGLELPAGLVEAMASRRMARRSGQGWFFAHGPLRDNIAQRAKASGRWSRWHRLCARVLPSLYPNPPRGLTERRAAHLFHGGQLEEALEPLLRAAITRHAAGEMVETERLLERRERAMTLLQLDPDDGRWGQGWIWRAVVLRRRSRYDEAIRFANEAIALARRVGDTKLLADALHYQSAIVFDQGDTDRAFAITAEAYALYEGLGSRSHMILSKHREGSLRFLCGDIEGAQACFERALAWVDERDDRADDPERARIVSGLALVFSRQGRGDEAIALLQDALRLHRALGNNVQVINCMNDLGEAERQRGEHAKARSWYERALTLYDSIGSRLVVIARINLALTHLALRDFAAARALLERVIDDTERTGQVAISGLAHAEILPCVAAARDWPAWDRHLDEARRVILDSTLADKDDAWAVQLGAELAAAAGEVERARAAYAFAGELWRRLGHEARVEESEAASAALG